MLGRKDRENGQFLRVGRETWRAKVSDEMKDCVVQGKRRELTMNAEQV